MSVALLMASSCNFQSTPILRINSNIHPYYGFSEANLQLLAALHVYIDCRSQCVHGNGTVRKNREGDSSRVKSVCHSIESLSH